MSKMRLFINVIICFIFLPIYAKAYETSLDTLKTVLLEEQEEKSAYSEPDLKLVWNDEFSGSGDPDPNKWERMDYLRKPNANGPEGYWDKEDAYLDGDGNLIIRCRRIENKNYDNDPYDYSVGAVRTKGRFEHKYGRYEIRCQLPKQQGWWVAFLMMQGNVGQVGQGGVDGQEVDIFEAWGWTDKVQHALHWDGYGSDHKSIDDNSKIEGIHDGFHTYTLDWYPDAYVFYVDGEEKWRGTGGGVCQEPGYLKVTGELSTENWATTEKWAKDPSIASFPDYFIIDYVRVYDLIQPSEIEYVLNVDGGTGDGVFSKGKTVNVYADDSESGMTFSHWSGETDYIADVYQSATTVTIPGRNIGIVANYKPSDSSSNNTPIHTEESTIMNGTQKNGMASSSVFKTRIEAEDYIKMYGVKTQQCSDSEGGINVSYIEKNDWMEYNCHFPKTGEYELRFRLASMRRGGKLEVEINNKKIGELKVPKTNGWQKWMTESIKFSAQEGEQTIRLLAKSGDFNLNWIELTDKQNTYHLTVVNGSGEGDFEAETFVKITPDKAPLGKVFDKWVAFPKMKVDLPFQMPDHDVKLTAIYKDHSESDNRKETGTLKSSSIIEDFTPPSDRDYYIVYPNPCSDFLYIVSKAGKFSFRLRDSMGKIVRQKKNVESNYKINTQSLDNGIYILQLNGLNGGFVKKIVVQ